MPNSQADRNLLFGILALQMDFISRDALIKAMQAWVLEKSKPLGQILAEQGALTVDLRDFVEVMIAKHLQVHGNDAEKSLAAFGSAGSVRAELQQIADPDLNASLANVLQDWRAANDPNNTVSFHVGTPTSAGLRFRILRPHAEGGLGKVSVAHDEELHREVALKEIKDHHADNQESRARFLLEAEITGGLEHPGIVPVYGLGQYADGRPYYAMRFIRGDSLKDAIERFHKAEVAGRDPGERTLELRKLLGRFIDVCQAIQYAHDRGVLHRDLKPGNIMLGKYGETLVVDWGLAKASGRTASQGRPDSVAEEPTLNPSSGSGVAETQAGHAIGTPAYMSPEQAAGRPDLLGPASDVYSLGATLYFLLTGKTPVDEKDTPEVLRKVQRGDLIAPRQRKPDLDRALEGICLKAMALKPGDRYASPRAFADEMEHWLADEPVAAWPEPVTVRARRWTRRHKPLVSGIAAALLVGLLALTMGAIYYHNQEAEFAYKQKIAKETVHLSLVKARQTRDDLLKVLNQPGGIQEMLNQPARWEALIKSANADWRRAKDNVDGTLDPHLMDLVKAMDKELTRDQAEFILSTRLEKIRLDAATWIEGNFNYAAAAQDYPNAFDQAGVFIRNGKANEVAKVIADSTIKDQILAGLDDWAYVAFLFKDAELRNRLLDLARRVDPDPWRNQVRDPAAWKDQQRVVKLAQDAQKDGAFFARLSPQMLDLVGHLLPEGSARENWLRAAQALHPGDFWLSFSLAKSLQSRAKDSPEAAGFYRVALAIRPNSSATLTNLGNVYLAQNNAPAAADVFKKATAIDAYNKALAIKNMDANAWVNLGVALYRKKDLTAALDAYKKAIAIDPQNATAWNNFGFLMRDKKDLSTAVNAFQKAIEFQPAMPEAHLNLGSTLREQGKFVAALKAAEESHRLGSLRKEWKYPSAELVKSCQNLAKLDENLPNALQGKATTAREYVEMATMCLLYKRQYDDAVELFRRAFLADPALGNDAVKSHRYNAACAAALGAAGQGVDADKRKDADRTRLRKQALAWLTEDLPARAPVPATTAQAVLTFLDDMQHWQRDPDLAGLRDVKDLAKLPEDERATARKFWSDVERLTKDAHARFTRTEHKGKLAGKDLEKNYPLKLSAGVSYVIDMESPQFDTFLRLEDEKGKVVATNDDISKTNLNSRILFTAAKDGAYRIVATSFEQRGTGAYTVTVREFVTKKK